MISIAPAYAPYPLAVCVGCHLHPRSEHTTDGAFCSSACEEKWAASVLKRVSGDECLEIMAAVMSRSEEHEADKVRTRIKAFLAGGTL